MKSLQQYIYESATNAFVIEFGKILYDKYKDSEWMGDYELKVDFDPKDRPFKLDTEDDWTLLAQWNKKNGEDIWGIWIIERPESENGFTAEPRIDVRDLSPHKQKLLINFVKRHK